MYIFSYICIPFVIDEGGGREEGVQNSGSLEGREYTTYFSTCRAI